MERFHTCTWNDKCVLDLVPGAIFDEKPFKFIADVVQGVLTVGCSLDKIPGYVAELKINQKQVTQVKQGDPSVMIIMSE